ncbi:MAG: ABC transporter permease [Bacteroides sp.]|nr:ABC transporter permease [Bacteroides sp.]MBD5357545.1 ABC transporter permease [Bacteroides sp.]
MKLTIFDIENWKEIGATLMRNKTRTFLTGFGIFWGVAMLAMLTGGARGGEDMLSRVFAGMATNSAGIITESTTMAYKGYQKGRSWNMNMTDVALLEEAFPELDGVVPIFQKWGQTFRNGKNSTAGQLVGADENYGKVLLPKIYGGRFINEADVRGERKVAVIGKRVSDKLFPTDSTPLGRVIEVGGTAYSVVGVAGDISEVHLNGSLDEGMVVPASTFRRANGYGDNVDFMIVTAKDNVDMVTLVPRIRSVIYRRHDIHPDDTGAMWVVNVAEMFQQVDMVFTGVDLLAWFIGLSTLIAGVIGIGNIMWVIVKERTQEIGIRRAIGAKPRDIIVQVLSEGVALTMIFGMAGICFAAIVLGIVHYATNPPDSVTEAHFQMSFMTAVGILILFMVLGTLAGLVPSVKAMRIKPIEALNSK